jgi:hypothetical protein
MNVNDTSDNTDVNIVVSVWRDSLDASWHQVRSPYVERFYMPVLGPTATFVARRLALELDASDGQPIDVNLPELASCLGLTYSHGRSSPFSKALQRLVKFGVAHQTDTGLALRIRWPDVAHRHTRRWPERLQQEHLDAVGI